MKKLNLDEGVVKELADTGVLYGHKKTKTHPRMKPFIALTKNEIEILDPEAIIESFETAVSFMCEKIKSGGLILCVGTISSAKDAILKMAEELNCPFVINRWLGGTLTNFNVINNRILHYSDLKSKKENKEFIKYTKKEQHRFSETINKLTQHFEGLVKLVRLPDLLFVIDPKIHHTAIREAKRLKIPIVAIQDTDDDPSLIDYPIFANDHAKSSINWISGKILERIKNP